MVNEESPVVEVVVHQEPTTTNQLSPIVGMADDKLGTDVIVAKLSNLQLSGRDSPQTRQLPKRAMLKAGNCDEFLQHNNSVCVDFSEEGGGGNSASSDLMAIIKEVVAEGKEEDEEEDDDDAEDEENNTVAGEEEEEEDDDGKELPAPGKERMIRKSLSVERTEIAAIKAQRVHSSKSMCDNDLRVDHLINKKDSMRIRFDDNGEAQIQKRDILNRKFYKSVDDELHKKALTSMSGNKSQCMTLDRVFKKLRGRKW